MLVDTHSWLTRLASTMDANDFNHISCAYLPQPSRSQPALLCGDVLVPSIASQVRRSRLLALMPPPAPPSQENPIEAPSSPSPSTRADFDVSQYLVDKSPIIGFGTKRPFYQY